MRGVSTTGINVVEVKLPTVRTPSFSHRPVYSGKYDVHPIQPLIRPLSPLSIEHALYAEDITSQHTLGARRTYFTRFVSYSNDFFYNCSSGRSIKLKSF